VNFIVSLAINLERFINTKNEKEIIHKEWSE